MDDRGNPIDWITGRDGMLGALSGQELDDLQNSGKLNLLGIERRLDERKREQPLNCLVLIRVWEQFGTKWAIWRRFEQRDTPVKRERPSSADLPRISFSIPYGAPTRPSP
jgi:hypothetical protein